MKIILLFIFFCSPIWLQAQVPEDAIRYSFYPQTGTARNMAIGGVMGSLGGDIQATFVNPAGLGFYKTNEFVLTPGLFLNNNKAIFRETASTNKATNLGFGTSGWVFGHANQQHPQNSSAFSIAINQTVNFNHDIRYSGLNNYSSMSEQFAEEFAKANARYGYTIADVLNNNSPLPYGAAPALFTYLIDTITVGGQIRVKGAPEFILDAGEAIQQDMVQKTRGGISELSLGFAHNTQDKWFVGGAIGVPIIRYSSKTEFKESDSSGNTSNYFKQFVYTDEFTTKGIGLNARIGIIYRPKQFIRLGLAIHTPSWMFLRDQRTTSMETALENPVARFSVSSNTFTNNMPGEAQYIQSTPFKAILSASYVFREVKDITRQKGFISADIEYVAHRGSRFSSDNETVTDEEKLYYSELNQVVKTAYKGNFNFRVGGELKFKVFMTRLGFAYYSNPYKDKELKANNLLVSGGIGYRNSGFFIDLTYVHAFNKAISFPYRLEDRANTFATLHNQRGNLVATLGFKF